MEDKDLWRREATERGRLVVESGRIMSADLELTEFWDLCRYWEYERDIAEARGCCSKCGPKELVEVTSGMGHKKVMCRRIWRECPNQGK
jgi:hypothetical protein